MGNAGETDWGNDGEEKWESEGWTLERPACELHKVTDVRGKKGKRKWRRKKEWEGTEVLACDEVWAWVRLCCMSSVACGCRWVCCMATVACGLMGEAWQTDEKPGVGRMGVVDRCQFVEARLEKRGAMGNEGRRGGLA